MPISVNYIYIFIAPTGAPVNFDITVNGTTLNCSWEPPLLSLQNGIIISYTIICLVDDSIAVYETVSNETNSFILDHYSPYTVYNCSVFASTEAGDGPVAEYVNVTTES